MKKSFAFAIIALASSMAMATNQGSNGQGNGGGGGGGGGGGSGVAVAAVNNQVGITSTVGLTASLGVRGGDVVNSASGGSATGLGGSVGNVGASVGAGAGSGSATLVNNYRPAAATAYAPAGSAPRTSCRLYIGLGGGNVNGSGSGGIPIGNDQTCLTGTGIDTMDQINAKFGETFGRDDYLTVACKVEGMSATKVCAAHKAAQPVAEQRGLGNGYIGG